MLPRVLLRIPRPYTTCVHINFCVWSDARSDASTLTVGGFPHSYSKFLGFAGRMVGRIEYYLSLGSLRLAQSVCFPITLQFFHWAFCHHHHRAILTPWPPIYAVIPFTDAPAIASTWTPSRPSRTNSYSITIHHRSFFNTNPSIWTLFSLT